jgi:hypothetical protein
MRKRRTPDQIQQLLTEADRFLLPVEKLVQQQDCVLFNLPSRPSNGGCPGVGSRPVRYRIQLRVEILHRRGLRRGGRRQGRHHRLGPGPRLARQHLAAQVDPV